MNEAETLGGRIAVLEGGRIVQLGSLDEVRREPATPFVQELLAGGGPNGSWRAPDSGPGAGTHHDAPLEQL